VIVTTALGPYEFAPAGKPAPGEGDRFFEQLKSGAKTAAGVGVGAAIVGGAALFGIGRWSGRRAQRRVVGG